MTQRQQGEHGQSGKSHFLARLIDKAHGRAVVVEPRLPSLFEPALEFGVDKRIEAEKPTYESLEDVDETMEMPPLALRKARLDDTHVSLGICSSAHGEALSAEVATRDESRPDTVGKPPAVISSKPAVGSRSIRNAPTMMETSTPDDSLPLTVENTALFISSHPPSRNAPTMTAASTQEQSLPHTVEKTEPAIMWKPATSTRTIRDAPTTREMAKGTPYRHGFSLRSVAVQQAEPDSHPTTANVATPQAPPPRRAPGLLTDTSELVSIKPSRTTEADPSVRAMLRQSRSEPAPAGVLVERQAVAFRPSTVMPHSQSRNVPRAQSRNEHPPAPAAAPTINVTIGRIEVRAVSGASAPARASAAPRPPHPMSLAQYLKQGRGRQ
jgi:hypothetical protein